MPMCSVIFLEKPNDSNLHNSTQNRVNRIVCTYPAVFFSCLLLQRDHYMVVLSGDMQYHYVITFVIYNQCEQDPYLLFLMCPYRFSYPSCNQLLMAIFAPASIHSLMQKNLKVAALPSA